MSYDELTHAINEIVSRHETALRRFADSAVPGRPPSGDADAAIEAFRRDRERERLSASIDVASDALRSLEAQNAHLMDVLRAERAHRMDGDPYGLWLRANESRDADLEIMRRISAQLGYRPTFSVLMPTYDTNATHLRAAIDSVREQAYPYWELCIADDASPSAHVREIIDRYAAMDSRIRVIHREVNGHISEATNTALGIATGEFVVLLDHDDMLAPDALFHNALAIIENPATDMLYSDEDKFRDDGSRFDPHFKPGWCPDSLLSRMYTCHLGVYRTAVAREIGGFRKGFEGSQDYDFVLRFTERTQAIAHIPRVLYHWRMHVKSTAFAADAKPYAREAACRAIEEAMQRRGEPGRVEVADVPGVYVARYDITRPGMVSIIIPTRNHGEDVDRCLRSIFDRPSAVAFEILIVDNGSDESASLATFAAWARRDERVRVLRYDEPFNFSKINNFAARKANGTYLLFLNNDTEAISEDWLAAMVEQAQRPQTGAVGAMLYYPDETVQHAGVIIGLGGVAGHSHKYFMRAQPGYFNMLRAINNYTAVTAACLMVRRDVFEEVGGFEESLAVAFNDVDFCLKISAAGYRNVCLPHAKLYHFESKSRGHEDSPEKVARFNREVEAMIARWKTDTSGDPCYSPNLTLFHENFSIARPVAEAASEAGR